MSIHLGASIHQLIHFSYMYLDAQAVGYSCVAFVTHVFLYVHVVVTELSGVVTVMVDSQKVLGADGYQASHIWFLSNNDANLLKLLAVALRQL